MFRKRKTFFSVVSVLLFCFCVLSVAAAPKKEKGFSIDQMSDLEKEFFFRRSGVVLPYLTCIAAAKEDSSYCNYLGQEESKACLRYYYRFIDFYSTLFADGIVSDRSLGACLKKDQVIGESIKDSLILCTQEAELILSKDPSLCRERARKGRNRVFCEAAALDDPEVCQPDKVCRDQIYLLRAIKSKRISDCSKIKHESLRMLCKGHLYKREAICQECEGFRAFFRAYQKEEAPKVLEPVKEGMNYETKKENPFTKLQKRD